MKKINLSADEALDLLLTGNERFASGLRSIEPFISSMRLKELADNGQKPFAIVLTCSDSRVPTETVFDRGVGDIFVVRMAGNVVSPTILASIEYAALNFGTELVLVMGHTQCGAINAAITQEVTGEMAPSMNLRALIKKIQPSVRKNIAKIVHDSKDSDLVTRVTQDNTRHSVEMILKKSKILRELAGKNKMKVMGAIYDLHTGRVHVQETDASAETQVNTASASTDKVNCYSA